MSASDLIYTIANQLVDDPAQIKIQETEDRHGRVLTLEVAEEDRGRIVGRGGKTAQAIRTLLSVFSMKYGERIKLEIKG